MSKSRKTTIQHHGAAITVLTQKEEDFFGFKPLEFEGFKTKAGLNSIWEQLNSPDFNSVEFDGVRMLIGLNSSRRRYSSQRPH